MNQLHITTNHNGKMLGLQSLSTSCRHNPNCERYKNINGGICQHCYAETMQKRYLNLDHVGLKNAGILTAQLLTADQVPTINSLYFRFEAFGDLYNITHFKNYCLIAENNPNVNFALWTKNGNIINQFVKDGGSIPQNLQIVLSSFKVNERTAYKFDTFKYKVFTVYDKQHADQVHINCGSKKCNVCLLCYKKNNVKYINEILK